MCFCCFFFYVACSPCCVCDFWFSWFISFWFQGFLVFFSLAFGAFFLWSPGPNVVWGRWSPFFGASSAQEVHNLSLCCVCVCRRAALRAALALQRKPVGHFCGFAGFGLQWFLRLSALGGLCRFGLTFGCGLPVFPTLTHHRVGASKIEIWVNTRRRKKKT